MMEPEYKVGAIVLTALLMFFTSIIVSISYVELRKIESQERIELMKAGRYTPVEIER
jgi:hypothetical protein